MEGNEVEEKIVGDLDWDGLHRPRIYYAVATTFCGLFRNSTVRYVMWRCLVLPGSLVFHRRILFG